MMRIRTISCFAVLLAACGTTAKNDTLPTSTNDSKGQAPLPPDEPPIKALDGGAKETGFRVTAIAIAAGTSGASVAYARECRSCSDASAGGGADKDKSTDRVDPEQVDVSVRLYGGSTKEGANPLYEAKDVRRGAVSVIGGVRAGALDWVLMQTADGMLQANAVAAPFVPGGSVITAALSTARQTPNASFGGMVRSAFALGHDDGSVQFLLRSRDDGTGVVSTISADGKTVEDAALTPKNADIAVLTEANGHLAVAYRSPVESPVDGPITVAMGGGAPEIVLPMKGVPAALWTNGLAYRVVVKSSDSLAVLYDGATTVQLPRSDEAACTAVAFAPNGDLFMLHAGPRSAVLYAVRDVVLSGPKVMSQRDEASASQTAACNLAVGTEVLHAAWVEDDYQIQYQALDAKTGALYARTRHDTAKNSVGNIR